MKQRQQQQIATKPERVFTISNGLSFFRLLLTIPTVMLLQQSYEYRMWIFGVAVIAYVSDLLDGFIARKFEGESSFGRILDPLADKVLVAGAVIVMVDQYLLPLWYVLVVLCRDAVILIAGIVLRKRTAIVVQSTMMGKVAVAFVALVLLMALFQDVVPNTIFNFMLIVSLVLLVMSLYVYGERFLQMMKRKNG